MKNTQEILNKFRDKKGQVAVLIDPEKSNDQKELIELIKKSEFAGVSFFFVGGSTVTREELQRTVNLLKENSSIPVVIFPGASHQISEKADAILLLSLISGRNPDYLIGHHVMAAPELYDMDIEVIPTAYLLIDGGSRSSVAYVSQTTPIPNDKSSIIVNTAKAGILQGKQVTYVDAGSGASNHVPVQVIEKLAELRVPVIVGGGIRTLEELKGLSQAGANVIVIGNKLEEDINFLLDIKSFVETK